MIVPFQSNIKIHTATAVQTIGVVGTGLMGREIAIAHAAQGINVLLDDLCEQSLTNAVESIRKKTTDFNHNPQVIAVNETNDFANADLVIESIVESQSIKRRVLAKIESSLHEDAILVTNTSSIPITQLASRLQRPEQFCGLHFFHPVDEMPLVEIIKGEKTSQQTIDRVLSHVVSLGKIPVVVQDSPGFVVNRFLSLYLDAALSLLQAGANPLKIDETAEQFGMPMGPLKLLDSIGIDTATRVGYVIQSAFPQRLAPSELLYALFQSEYLGQKNGKGFYLYDEEGNRLPQIDPFVKETIAQHTSQPVLHTTETITERLFLPQVVDATRIVEEKLVQRAEDIDIAIVNGLGFPSSKGGILSWGDRLGVVQLLLSLEKYKTLGERFQPTSTLLACANSRSSLISSCNQSLQSTIKPLRKAG